MFLNIEVSVVVAMSYVNGVDACGDDVHCFLPQYFGTPGQATHNRRVQECVLGFDDDGRLRTLKRRM